MGRRPLGRLSLALLLLSSSQAQSQGLPSEPISLANGRLVLGGEATFTLGSEDPGYFNYSDYEYSTLRTVRLGLSAALRANSRLAVLSEVRSEGGAALRPYALFARLQPWPTRDLSIQVGRIPPVFGAFARRTYNPGNALIGYPLAYQYLTSLRPDALPATPEDRVRMRGRGWRASYPVGSPVAERGVPLISALRWDTGVAVKVGTGRVDYSAAVTTGTLSNPRVRDDNSGKQMTARIATRPLTGLIVGASAAQGAFLSRRVESFLAPGTELGDFTQRALGADVEYSRDRWIARSELISSLWLLPRVDVPAATERLRATAWSTEARYVLTPGLYVAARFDRLWFNQILTSRGPQRWDDPVSRLEAGGGYSLRRNLIARVAYQHDRRESSRFRTASLIAGQLAFWF